MPADEVKSYTFTEAQFDEFSKAMTKRLAKEHRLTSCDFAGKALDVFANEVNGMSVTGSAETRTIAREVLEAVAAAALVCAARIRMMAEDA